MKELPKISDAEWQVMKVLWEKSPLTSSEIIEVLKPTTTWNPKTIHTLIRRLVKKEAVGVREGSPYNLYFPIVSKDECQMEETKSFLDKVYEGSLKLLLASFIEDEKLSPGEIEELKRILDEKKG